MWGGGDDGRSLRASELFGHSQVEIDISQRPIDVSARSQTGCQVAIACLSTAFALNGLQFVFSGFLVRRQRVTPIEAEV